MRCKILYITSYGWIIPLDSTRFTNRTGTPSFERKISPMDRVRGLLLRAGNILYFFSSVPNTIFNSNIANLCPRTNTRTVL